MRVLQLNTETGFRGGERQVALLMRGLRERGHEQILVARKGSELAEAMKAEGFTVRTFQPPGFLGIRGPLLSRWVRQTADEFEADLVHAHTGNSHTLAVAGFSQRLPMVTTRRVDFPVGQNWLSRRKYLAPGQHYIAISQGVADVLMEGGIAREHITIVHSGIEPERVQGGDGTALRREWLGEDCGPLIGFVGSLVDHKAPWVLADAAPLIREQLPGARVVFVGDGEMRARLEEIRESNPEAIHLAGHRDDIADCYAAFDLFAMPSKLEGLCTALIDALAAGVPAVATRTGGIPDVIQHGVTGDLVPPLDAESLAEALVSLWNDPKCREMYRDIGLARAEDRFTAKAMVEGTERVYTEILEGLSSEA